MYTPFRRMSINVWCLEFPPGNPRLFVGFGSESGEVIKVISSNMGLTTERGIDDGDMRYAFVRRADPVPEESILPIPELKAALESKVAINLDLLCQRPMGHEGVCGKFSEADMGRQVNESGLLIPTCLKPLG